MPTKEEQLDALVPVAEDLVVHLEIPDATKWNKPRTLLQQLLPLLGDFFTDTDAQIEALRDLFEADHDDITGANPVPTEWVPDAAAPTFVNATQLRLPGDRRADYAAGHRVRVTQGAAFTIVAIAIVGFDAGQNVTTITVDAPVLASNLNAIARGLVRFSAPKVLAADLVPEAVTGPKIAPLAVDSTKLAVRATVPAPPVKVPFPNPLPFALVTIAGAGESAAFVTLIITTLGGYVDLGGVLTMRFTSGAGFLRVRVRRNGGEIHSTDVEVAAGAQVAVLNVCPTLVDDPPAGTHTYTLTFEMLTGGPLTISPPLSTLLAPAQTAGMYAKESR